MENDACVRGGKSRGAPRGLKLYKRVVWGGGLGLKRPYRKRGILLGGKMGEKTSPQTRGNGEVMGKRLKR